MAQHPDTPVPKVPGIDLSFRPGTYFGPIPLETHLLAHITGHERRELVRRRLAASHDGPLPDLTGSTLDEDTRVTIGRLHPSFMGGEYLPPLAYNETEIARISLASLTADQVSVRARLDRGRIVYRIVDEYEGECIQYECRPAETVLPLTLGELVTMLDAACEGGGAAMSHLVRNMDLGGVPPRSLRKFVRVGSEFYRQLSEYYEWRIDAWFKAQYPLTLNKDD